jgi:hypothetical protein
MRLEDLTRGRSGGTERGGSDGNYDVSQLGTYHVYICFHVHKLKSLINFF